MTKTETSITGTEAGRPDYYRSTAVERPEIGTKQTPVVLTGEVSVPADTTVPADIYTVPASKKFVIGFIGLSADKDVITKGSILKNGNDYVLMHTDFRITTSVPNTAGHQFTSGDVLGLRIVNPLSESADFRYVISGFLYLTRGS